MSLRRLIRKSSVALATLALMLSAAEAVVRTLAPARNVGPSFTVFDEEHGVSLKRNLECERFTPEFTMALTTNSLGQRGVEPSDGAQGGVLFLGDSFTLGYGVNDGEEFPAIVRAVLKRGLGENVAVWNTGIGGVGNGRWLKTLEQDAPDWKPELVVMQLCGNDFDDNYSEGLYSVSPEGKLIEHSARKAAPLKRALQGIVESVPGLAYSHLVCLFRGGRRAASSENAGQGAGSSARDELTWKILERAIDEAESLGARVVLLTAAVSKARVERARELGIPVMAVPSKQARPDLYYERDGHWNLSGQVAAAQLVIAEILPEMLRE